MDDSRKMQLADQPQFTVETPYFQACYLMKQVVLFRPDHARAVDKGKKHFLSPPGGFDDSNSISAPDWPMRR